MKFLLKYLSIFIIIYLVLNWIIYFLDDGHNINYNIGNFSVNEILDKDGYFFILKGENSHLNFKMSHNYNKEEKVLTKLYNKNFSGNNCFLPVFKGGKILTDVLCLKDDILYLGSSLNNLEIDNYFKKYGYNPKDYDDNGEKITVSPTITLYKNNLSSDNYLALESYTGLTLFNSKDASIRLFDKDVYKKPISIFTDKYYLCADYNSEFSFKNLFLVNIVNGEKKSIRSYDDISFDSYIMGVVEEKVYLFDKENKKQYSIDIKNEDVEMIGDKDNIRFYDGKWVTISLNEALSEKKFFNKSNIKGYDKVDEVFGIYYLYKKSGDDYLVYMMDRRDDIKTFIFKTSKLSDIIYLKDKVYFKDGNDYCYYSKDGIRRVITDTEFEFNDDISIGVYSK